MADAPTPYDFINQRLDRIENKIDAVGQRTIGREEFDRYRLDVQLTITRLEASIAEVNTALATYQAQQQDNASKWRLFWSGLALTPLVSGLIAFLISGGLPQ